jgi:CsoR family transcriptional regulator, copper-sensing transcriptional repressor
MGEAEGSKEIEETLETEGTEEAFYPHKERKQVVNRLARIEGHVRAIKEMAKTGRDCPELLIQIAAVRRALDGVAKVVLKDHLNECVVSSIGRENQEKILNDFQNALDRYIR